MMRDGPRPPAVWLKHARGADFGLRVNVDKKRMEAGDMDRWTNALHKGSFVQLPTPRSFRRLR